jgi:Flp pilus assembly protein TadD
MKPSFPSMLLLAALTLILTAVTALAQGESEDEEEARRRAEWRAKWTTDPNNVDQRWERAAKLRYNGKVDEAMDLYREFLAEDENEISVVVSMGTAWWEKGEFDKAIEWFERAKKMVHRQIKARQFLGQIYFFLGRFEEAKKEMEDLLALDYPSPNVNASARLNLAKIALIQRRFRDADKLFYQVGKSPEKGDRASAEKGRFLTMRMRKTKYWNKELTKNLEIHFSPKIPEESDPGFRKRWAAARQAAFDRITSQLGLEFKERIPVYAFRDMGDGYEVSGQDKIPSPRYSWWLTWTTWDSDPGRDLGYMLVARAAGSRPANIPWVCGLVAWLDDDKSDPHATARELLRKGELPSCVRIYSDQRYSLQRALEYGESFVAHIIETYGLEAFLRCYRSYNNVMCDTGFIDPVTRIKDWDAALSEVLRRGTGQDLRTIESSWHQRLRR